MLQARRPWVRFPMSLDFSIDSNLPASLALGSTKPITKMSTRNIPGGKWQPVCKAHGFTAICEPIPIGLHGLLQG
jgi:hypothetical protein